MHLVNPTSESIQQAINLASLGNTDRILAGTKATPIIGEKGELRFQFNSDELTSRLRGAAEAQYLTRIEVASTFFHKCSSGLKHSILSEFHQIGKSYMFRCKPAGDEQLIRAVLGPQFPTD